MLSNWHRVEIEKAIAEYRDTIAGLEDIKQNTRRCDRDQLWWQQADTQIEHLQKSIAALESVLPSLV